MPKIRTIKPEFWSDEDIVSCSITTRLFFLGLWNFADDDGVFEWKPLSLKMKVFPNDEIHVSACLTELKKHGRIACFTKEGKQYGIIKNFAKHQKVDVRFRKSTIGDLTGLDIHYDEATSRTHREHDVGGGGGVGMITPSIEGVSAEADARPEVVDEIEA